MNIQPSFAQFRTLAQKGNLVPVVCNVTTDLETPVSVFLKLARNEPHAFLLESVELGEQLGRFSLIGMDPEMILEYTGRSAMVRQRKTKKRMNGDFLNLVQQLLKPYHLVRHPSLPPLVGGFVGYHKNSSGKGVEPSKTAIFINFKSLFFKDLK